ncbi:voltage-gated potassium channel [Flexibacter flexilis DSM 6793]|uniref:Voltage-gated potassium channel n=1 Tax=Flexibacter flexilis DSM 6793 TaxID=927664 RepID=A0A1I1G6Q9_9BACT|nr:potassium channel protein [Flexibacter flexilis]SFC04890.1 voltage-gated potassium channel [Flexibacter flexilis DSM 6793]
MDSERYGAYWKIMIVLVSLFVGVTGFMLIEDLSFVDALYMSVTTLSTVGYGEVKTFSAAGRLFVVFYVSFNLLMLGYFTVQFIEKKIESMFGTEHLQREIDLLDGHTIVCGFGRNGQKVAEELFLAKKSFVVIEKPEVIVANIRKTNLLGLLYVEGDATDDEILKKAGITRASVIITTLPDDANNVFITLTAREFNSSIRVISRASQESSVAKLNRAGVTNVVMPDALGGWHMANLVTRPEVIEFLSLLNGTESNRFKLDEISFHNIALDFREKSIAEWKLAQNTDVVIIGLRNAYKQFTVNPDPQTILKPSEILIVFGSETSIERMKNIYCA